ncbi:MAG: hypothetical protein ACRD2A_03645 [Vicinamibacterales bacterium]
MAGRLTLSRLTTAADRSFCTLLMAGIAIGVQTKKTGQSIGLPDKK